MSDGDRQVQVTFDIVDGNYKNGEIQRPFIAVKLTGLSRQQYDVVGEILDEMEPIATGHTDFISLAPLQHQVDGRNVMVADSQGNPPMVSFVRADDATGFLKQLQEYRIADYTHDLRKEFEAAKKRYLTNLHPEHDR